MVSCAPPLCKGIKQYLTACLGTADILAPNAKRVKGQ